MHYNKKSKNKPTIKEIIFIITARGGSKRLPKKNMKLLKGKPLIFWTFNAIKKAYKNAKVYTSTDSEKIANYSEKMGIKVPFIRPHYISRDNSSSFSVIKHFLKWKKNKEKKLPKYLILLQPTSPFRTSKTIKECTRKLLENDNCNAVVAMKYQKNDIDTLKLLDKNMQLKNLFFTKNLKKVLEPTGAFYGIKIRALLKQKTFLPNKTIPHIINEVESIDIDNKYDWQMAKKFSDKLTT